MGGEKSPLAEAYATLEQKYASFLDALKVAAKESGKIGSGMKAKYNELLAAGSSFTKTLSKSNGTDTVQQFPLKLACCILLEAVAFANTKTKPLIANIAAVQQLSGIVDYLYSVGTINTTDDNPVRMPLDSNELYIYVDMLFKVFETIAKVEKLEDAVQLRVVETVLQFFTVSSPFMIYEDIIRRSFAFLDDMLQRKHVKHIVEGAMKQLTDCLLSTRKVKSGAAVGHQAREVAEEINNVDLVVDIICCCCSIVRNEKPEFMRNVEPSNASEMLLVAITTLPKGALFDLPRLQAIAKGELYSTVKYVLAGGIHVQDGCMLLARILDHGYYHSNRFPDTDRALVKLYESLFNFVELDLIDTSTVDGMQRQLAWIRAMALLMQSNEMLNELRNERATRKFVVDMLKFAVKHVKLTPETELDAFFDGIYSSGNGQQLILEQIDNMEQSGGSAWPGYLKLLPLFVVKPEPNSCATDFSNLTNGSVHKFSRFIGSESKEMVQLEMMHSAITVDMVLVVCHVLYSLVVGTHRDEPQFAHYRMFYPKMVGEDVSSPYKAHGSSNTLQATSDDALDCDFEHLKEIHSIVLTQLENWMGCMRSAIMQQAFLSVLQGLLIVCNICRWKQDYVRILTLSKSYIVTMEKELSKESKDIPVDNISLYLLHVRALGSLLLNYAAALDDYAWDHVLQHLLTFLFISRRLGIATRDHLKTLEPRPLDETIISTEIKETWVAVLTEVLAAFARIRAHDFKVLGKFVTYFGFHIAIPLLSKSHYALEPDTVAGSRSPRDREGKLGVIKKTLHAWPVEFVSMIEKDGDEWPQLMRDLAHSLDRDNILANADPEFLHCLFGMITELPFAREHDELMLLTGIIMILLRDYGALELMIETICGNVVSLFLAGHEGYKQTIDAGVCVLYKTMCENAALSTHVINGLKGMCTTVPQILAASKGVITCLAFATKNATANGDIGIMVNLIDVFVAIVENSVHSLQDESCLPFVECLFILAHGAYTADNNAAFRVIGVVLDFAEKMAARSHFFEGENPAREGEEEMWAALFKGLYGLGLSEYSEIRQCSIKSLAMFIKGRLNRFGDVMWNRCCTEMLLPLSEGLLNQVQTSENTQTIFTACDELCVALREGDERYQKYSETVMTTLIAALEKVVNTTLKNKEIYPNELNSVLSQAVSIATNIIIDYYHSDCVWNRSITVLQVMARKDLDLLKQNFLKSVCSILSALGEKDSAPEEKVGQVIRLALGEPTSGEKKDYESLCKDAKSGEPVDPMSLLPPWIFENYVSPTGEDTDSVDQEWIDITERIHLPMTDDPAETSPSVAMSKLREKLENTDEARIKITLRDKIQNSLGILQELQMLQLVTLHYSPQILHGTNALEKVSYADIPKAPDVLKSEVLESTPQRNGDMHSTLNDTLREEGRTAMVENMINHLKSPPLLSLVEAYSPISKLFRSLVTIKSPEIYDVLIRALVPKYLIAEISNVRLSLQLIDNIVSSAREILLRFLQQALKVITEEVDMTAFLESKEYRMLIKTMLPMVPMIMEVARRLLEKRALQPVCLIIYQECINLVKYMYFGIYLHVHFLPLEPVMTEPFADYWRATLKGIQFFSYFNYSDEVTSRIKYIRMLHAITLEMVSSLVVNPFSIAPPFVYDAVVMVLKGFAEGPSAVLRRIALQRLSDASCYPFIPTIANNQPKCNMIILKRVMITKRFLSVLVRHLRRMLRSTEDIEVLAALQVLESITTLPNELIFDQDYLRVHRYMKLVHKHPLVSVAIPHLLELVESDSKKIVRATRKVLSMFLEEMGAQVVLR